MGMNTHAMIANIATTRILSFLKKSYCLSEHIFPIVDCFQFPPDVCAISIIKQPNYTESDFDDVTLGSPAVSTNPDSANSPKERDY